MVRCRNPRTGMHPNSQFETPVICGLSLIFDHGTLYTTSLEYGPYTPAAS